MTPIAALLAVAVLGGCDPVRGSFVVVNECGRDVSGYFGYAPQEDVGVRFDTEKLRPYAQPIADGTERTVIPVETSGAYEVVVFATSGDDFLGWVPFDADSGEIRFVLSGQRCPN